MCVFPDGQAAANLASSAVLELLLGMSVHADEEDDGAELQLDKLCNAYVEIQKHVTSEVIQSLKPQWLPSACQAQQRFEMLIAKAGGEWVAKTWQNAGPAEVLTVLECCKYLPDSLQSVHRLAQFAPMVEKIEPVSDKDLNASSFGDELPNLLKAAKKWVTVASFTSEDMGKFFSEETVQKVTDFSLSVSKVIGKFLDAEKALLAEVKTVADKYELPVINGWVGCRCSRLVVTLFVCVWDQGRSSLQWTSGQWTGCSGCLQTAAALRRTLTL